MSHFGIKIADFTEIFFMCDISRSFRHIAYEVNNFANQSGIIRTTEKEQMFVSGERSPAEGII